MDTKLHPLQFFPCSSTELASHKSLKVLTSFYTGLMKILLTAKHGYCLEILAISLQVLSFSYCKAYGLIIQTLPFNAAHKQLHRLKSEDLRSHSPQINNSSPNISSVSSLRSFPFVNSLKNGARINLLNPSGYFMYLLTYSMEQSPS